MDVRENGRKWSSGWERWLLVVVASAVAFGASATAQAQVPVKFTQQGRLLDDSGEPVTGSVEMTFSIYDAATGGELLWEQAKQVEFDEGGFYSTELGGSNNPINATILEEGERWLQVRVDGGAPLEPRAALNAVPYATIAGTASAVADGSVTAASLASDFSVSGDQVGDVAWEQITDAPTGLDDGDQDTLGGMTCADGQTVQSDGTGWNCADGSSYDGGDFALSDQQCTGGQVANGIDATGTLACVEPASYDGGDFALSDQGCTGGQVVTGVDASGNLQCADPPENHPVVYHRLMTADWLFNNAQNFNPARGRTLTNNDGRLDFATGGGQDERLFEVPLVTAGALSTGETYVVKIDAYVEPLGVADNDIGIALSDGSDAVGVWKLDAGNDRSIEVHEFEDNGQTQYTYNSLNRAAAHGRTLRRLSGKIHLSSKTEVFARHAPTYRPAGAVATRVVDRDADLKIIAHANESNEQYGFYHIEVKIERETP